jgi:hypothetical protein
MSCDAGSAADRETGQAAGSKLIKRSNNNFIQFKANKTPVQTSGWTISRFMYSDDPSHQWLNITSNMNEERRTINVNLNGTVPGKYSFGNGGALDNESHGSYFPDYMSERSNDYSFINGSFNITEIDTVKRVVNATFSCTARNNKGEIIEITEGEIQNGSLNPGIRWY